MLKLWLSLSGNCRELASIATMPSSVRTLFERGAFARVALASTALLGSADGREVERLWRDAIANPANDKAVKRLLDNMKETEPGSGRYIVEGDYSLSREEFPSYLLSLQKPAPLETKSKELIVNVADNKLDYWVTSESRRLTYAFQIETFPSKAALEFTKNSFQVAAADWIAACPECRISFSEDSIENSTFTIRYSNVDRGLAALSFFPSTTSKRYLTVYRPFLRRSSPYDPTGILRHEIGHILGYRHEQVVGVPGCAFENKQWVQITKYDAKSIMHTPCVGGNLKMTLQASDVEGHKCIYLTGKPCQ